MKTRDLFAIVASLPLCGCAMDAHSMAAALSAGMLDEATRAATAPFAMLAAAPSSPPTSSAPVPSSHPSQARGPAPIEGDRRLAIGLGVTRGPDTRLLGAAADIYQSDRLAIGPALQWGFDNNATIFAPSFRGKYVFPLGDGGRDNLWMPFVEAGAGVIFLDKDNAPNSDRWGIVFQAGGGIELRLNENMGLGSKLLMNFLPGETFDEGSYTSWEIIQVTFAF